MVAVQVVTVVSVVVVVMVMAAVTVVGVVLSVVVMERQCNGYRKASASDSSIVPKKGGGVIL